MRLLALLILFSPLTVMSQVANDGIHSRSELLVNAEPTISNTDYNTVEWECLNKKLTEKCLVYHNDQWFTFHVEKAGSYFINIASQKCRENLGVQLIVIEGNPCEVSTYRVLECIRRIDQGEVYLELKDLKEETSYLVNVDGFMGDFCEFRIQLSTSAWKPQVSTKRADSLSKVRARRMAVELQWDLNVETAKNISRFVVYRQRTGDQKYELIREMNVSLNALGVTATRYKVSDTLPAVGTYEFDVFGLPEEDSHPILVSEHRVTWDGARFNIWPPPPPNTVAAFAVDGRAGANIELVLLDDENVGRLWTRRLVFDPAKHSTMELDLEPWLKQGKKRFLMLVVDEEKREPVEYYFTTDRNGNVVQR